MNAARVAVVLVVVICVMAMAARPASTVDPVLMMDPDGATVRWPDWLAEHGPAAALIWSSWMPESSTTLDLLPSLEAACTARELSLVVVDVQEPHAAASEALRDVRVDWLHDRHGAILKQYRVIRVPALVVFSSDGELLARLAPTPEAVGGWQPTGTGP